MQELKPKDHREAVAIFRGEIIGALTRKELDRGELRAAFVALCKERFRAPASALTRSYSVPTLERWYYAYKKHGLAGLEPRARKDKGRARSLGKELRQLLSDIRKEYPSASASLILRTLVADGRIHKGQVEVSTLRRFFAEQGLCKIALRDGTGPKARLRWQAERPGAIWHADVCHGPTLLSGERRIPMRIHGIMDDASRHVVALVALEREREVDMLCVLLSALRRFGAPHMLYLDNGSTYRGDILRTACARLDVSLVHAKPYDPEARGKMERFWRTLRESCLDFIGQLSSLHDVNARLLAFLDVHYHRAPHAALMGQSPESVFLAAPQKADSLDERRLSEALTVRSRRRVRRDSTVCVGGADFEVSLGFLAGQVVTIAKSMAAPESPPWLEHAGKTYPLHPVDPTRNAQRGRPPRREGQTPTRHVAFDPPKALLDRAVGRSPSREEKGQ